MLLDTPDWSARHFYYWHSNPTRERAKVLFDKVHVRPKVKKAWDIINNPESSEAQKAEASKTIDQLATGKSAAMTGGIETQATCDSILLKDADVAEAIEKTLASYRDYKPRDWDDGSDAVRHQKYIEELPAVIENALAGLREAMFRDNRILGEIELLDKLPGLALPHNTRPDYNRRGDLKTKWSSPDKRSKSGFKAAAIPKSLSGMFDMNNVFQAAGFWALNGRQPPFLVYASASNYQVFTADNCDELKDDFLGDVLEEIKIQHRCTENLLRAAETKEQLLGMVAPNFQNIVWNEPPGYVAEAKRMWGMS